MPGIFKVLLIMSFLAATAVLSGCGGSGDKTDITINMKAENNRFVPDRIEIPAGKTVKLTLQNLDAADHDLQVTGLKAKTTSGGGHGEMNMDNSSSMSSDLAVHSQGKKSASVTFVAEQPGTYDFYCTQPGHKEVGMIGKLVVTGSGSSPATKAEPPAPAASSTQMTASTPVAVTAPIAPPTEGSDGGHPGH